MAIKAIARRLGVSRNAVRRALARDAPPKYERPARGCLVDAVEPQVRALLAGCPTMPATVIAQRIGWTRSLTVLKDRVRELRPLLVPPDPSDRVEYGPGEVAPCDLWFPAHQIPVGGGQERVLPVLATTCGYSRVTDAVMIPSCKAGDILAGMWQVLAGWDACPRTLDWDRQAAIGGTVRPTDTKVHRHRGPTPAGPGLDVSGRHVTEQRAISARAVRGRTRRPSRRAR